MFAEGTALLARAFDPDTQTLIGEPFKVAERVRVNANYRAFVSVSDNGTLVYDPNTDEDEGRQLTWYDRRGKRSGPSERRGRSFVSGCRPTRDCCRCRASAATSGEQRRPCHRHFPRRDLAARLLSGRDTPRRSGRPTVNTSRGTRDTVVEKPCSDEEARKAAPARPRFLSNPT